jgi:predicted TIM-barrel fold metal-dependent hydrolase
MKRRDFLGAVGLAAASSVCARAAGDKASIPSIDTHTHFYDPTRPQGVPWPKPTERLLYAPFLPADFRATAAPHRVVGTVVVEASPWLEDNQWLLDLGQRTPEIVAVVGHLKVGQPDFAAHLKRFAADPLFRGLRIGADVLNSQDIPAVAADLRRIADAGLSLDVIGRSAIVAPTARLARALPTVNIIVNHLPFPEWDQKPAEMRAALGSLAESKNVFIKVSDVVRRVNGEVVIDAAFYQPALDVLFDRFSSERLIYASNWPVSERVAPYATVHRVVKDYFSAKGESAAERFFWRNSLVAYRWNRPEIAARLSS